MCGMVAGMCCMVAAGKGLDCKKQHTRTSGREFLLPSLLLLVGTKLELKASCFLSHQWSYIQQRGS